MSLLNQWYTDKSFAWTEQIFTLEIQKLKLQGYLSRLCQNLTNAHMPKLKINPIKLQKLTRIKLQSALEICDLTNRHLKKVSQNLPQALAILILLPKKSAQYKNIPENALVVKSNLDCTNIKWSVQVLNWI